MKFRNLPASLALAGALLFAGTVNAAVLTLDFTGFKNGSESGSLTVNDNTNASAQAGLFTFNITNADGETDLMGQIMAFCLEADVFLDDTINYEDLTLQAYGFGDTRIANIEALFSKYLGQTGSSEKDAAFQLALWEIVYDDDFSFEAGMFQASGFGDSVALAKTWLDSLGSGSFETLWALRSLGEDDSQDLITWVPEPGTLALLGAGLIGFGAFRRRNRA